MICTSLYYVCQVHSQFCGLSDAARKCCLGLKCFFRKRWMFASFKHLSTQASNNKFDKFDLHQPLLCLPSIFSILNAPWVWSVFSGSVECLHPSSICQHKYLSSICQHKHPSHNCQKNILVLLNSKIVITNIQWLVH